MTHLLFAFLLLISSPALASRKDCLKQLRRSLVGDLNSKVEFDPDTFSFSEFSRRGGLGGSLLGEFEFKGEAIHLVVSGHTSRRRPRLLFRGERATPQSPISQTSAEWVTPKDPQAEIPKFLEIDSTRFLNSSGSEGISEVSGKLNGKNGEGKYRVEGWIKFRYEDDSYYADDAALQIFKVDQGVKTLVFERTRQQAADLIAQAVEGEALGKKFKEKRAPSYFVDVGYVSAPAVGRRRPARPVSESLDAKLLKDGENIRIKVAKERDGAGSQYRWSVPDDLKLKFTHRRVVAPGDSYEYYGVKLKNDYGDKYVFQVGLRILETERQRDAVDHEVSVEMIRVDSAGGEESVFEITGYEKLYEKVRRHLKD